ncbi:MAG: phosphohydrolase, partial [Actinomycetes bacterium]
MNAETNTGTKATFTKFEDSTREEWATIMECLKVTQSLVPDRIMEQLRHLGSDDGGFPVSRLEHCLQTATRAMRGGESDEYVACALIHD